MALMRLFSVRSLVSNCTKVCSTRGVKTTTSDLDEIKLAKSKPKWERALIDGERCVGHQTSFLGLRSITNYDVTNWGEHMNRLEGSAHPMHSAARILFQQGHENINKTWSLVILLMSKIAGFNSKTKLGDLDPSSGLLQSQRTLAEAVELSCYGNDIHREGVLNMQHMQYAGINLSPESDLIFGNKMAILGGDMLFGSAALQIGKIKHHEANMILCTAARDITDSHFLGDRDIQNNPLPSDPAKKLEEQKLNPLNFNDAPSDQIDNTKPFKLHDVMGSAESEWKLRHTLAGGTLIGKGCQAALMLANHSEELQREAYFFGKHLYLSWRASKDLEIFSTKSLPESGKFSLISAPILFHLEHDHSLYEEIKQGLESVDNINYEEVHKTVRNGPGLEKTQELLNNNFLITTTLLRKFPPSEARDALESIATALK